jgi:hypothetical protein
MVRTWCVFRLAPPSESPRRDPQISVSRAPRHVLDVTYQSVMFLLRLKEVAKTDPDSMRSAPRHYCHPGLVALVQRRVKAHNGQQ